MAWPHGRRCCRRQLRASNADVNIGSHIEHSLYGRVPPVSFSVDVLSAAVTGRLAVLRLKQAGWSDLGDPERALLAIRDGAHKTMWVTECATA